MENTIDLTTIANALIALAAAIITTFIIPWIRSKTTENQRRDIFAWVDVAVKAAEQLYKGPGLGAQKKRFVLNYIKSKGYTLDDMSVELALEAAVKEITEREALIYADEDANDEEGEDNE